jgi:hypothetical protein
MASSCHIPTTIGDEDAVAIDSPFQSMKAVDSTRPKDNTCASVCRVFDRLEERKDSIVTVRPSLGIGIC